MIRVLPLLLILGGVVCIFCTCKKEEICLTCPPPIKNTINLALNYTECTEVWLKLKFTDNNQPRGYAVFKDGKQLLSGILAGSDTVLVDDSVLAGCDYTYIAQRLNGSTAVDVSASLAVHTLDSTSHNIQWQVDTLGAYGIIRDVWVFDRNNAWAVGEIYLKDSTGQINMSNPYNAAHWDGSKWDLKKVSVNFRESIITPPLNAIFAFSNSDIWLSSGVPVHGDGNTWTQYHLFDMGVLSQSDGSISKIFGSNPGDLYFVGYKGTIVRYNGSTWTKINSSTTTDLQDIYGLDATHIWATGTNTDYNGTVILSFNGTTWKKLYEGNYYGFNSVWTSTGRTLIVAGISGPWTLKTANKTFSNLITPSQWIMYCVRASNSNDIFFSGANSEITHYNGSTYHLYQEVQSISSGNARWLCIKPTESFIIAGGGSDTGLYDIPVIARGYR